MSKITITDPIHGIITLYGIPAKIINLPEFDRLSQISQLAPSK